MEPAVKISLVVSMLSPHDARQVALSNQAASTGKGKDLVHSKHRVRTKGGPHRPQHELLIQVEDPNIIYRVIEKMPLRP